jgi:hypothetical protein
MIYSGEIFYSSAHNKHLCQSCTKLTTGWHCCQIWQVIFGHKIPKTKLCATEMGLIWPGDIYGQTVKVV